MAENSFYRDIFEIIGYMLTSARGLVDEPALYGPLRLIDGVSKLCTTVEKTDNKYRDFLTRLKTKIDDNKFVVMTDEKRFVEVLDELVIDYTKELKKL